MTMNVQIGDYDVDSVILDLGSDVNILTNNTWKNMGKPQLAWSPLQVRLANQAKVSPIGKIPRLMEEVKGMNTYRDFSDIEIVNEGSSYLALLDGLMPAWK